MKIDMMVPVQLSSVTEALLDEPFDALIEYIVFLSDSICNANFTEKLIKALEKSIDDEESFYFSKGE